MSYGVQSEAKNVANVGFQSTSTGWPKKMRTHILFDKKPIF